MVPFWTRPNSPIVLRFSPDYTVFTQQTRRETNSGSPSYQESDKSQNKCLTNDYISNEMSGLKVHFESHKLWDVTTINFLNKHCHSLNSIMWLYSATKNQFPTIHIICQGISFMLLQILHFKLCICRCTHFMIKQIKNICNDLLKKKN